MEDVRKPISLWTQFISGIIGIVIFVIPSFLIIYGFKLTNQILIFVLIAMIIIELPFVAIFMWLFGKASGWKNPNNLIQLNIIWPSRLSGLALGLFIGSRIFGLLGAIIGAILGYIIIFRILGIYVSKIIAQKIFKITS